MFCLFFKTTNSRTNVYDEMVLFNQWTLRNILNRCEDLGSVKPRAAVATLTKSIRMTQSVSYAQDWGLAGLPDG